AKQKSNDSNNRGNSEHPNGSTCCPTQPHRHCADDNCIDNDHVKSAAQDGHTHSKAGQRYEKRNPTSSSFFNRFQEKENDPREPGCRVERVGMACVANVSPECKRDC